jgi:Tol biopolymer transport system component
MKIQKRIPRQTMAVVFLMGWLFLTCPAAAAINHKLSGTMPPFGDVTSSFQFSPDGRTVVYQADQETDGVVNLYSVLVEGGAPVQLNPLLPSGRSVANFQISPDGSRVVYTADQDLDNVTELYSVPIGGPAWAGVKLNSSLVLNGNVQTFGISPDSQRVVYLADQQTDGIVELYRVPLDGSATAIKLNGTLVPNGNVLNCKISPDSQRVVYLADQQTDGIVELYSVPLDGSAAEIKLNKTLVSQGHISNFGISPNSQRVVYVADQDTYNVFELYSVPIGGPAANGIKLNGSLVLGGNVDRIFINISPDSSRVVYQADQQTDGVFELYSVPLAGPASAGVKLNGPLVPGGNVDFIIRISQDSSRVVYRADQQTDEIFELYSVPLTGPASGGDKLNGPLVVGGNVTGTYGFHISPDSQRVVYTADQDTNNVTELYSVPLGGPASAGVKLNGPLVAGGNVDLFDFRISPDSSRVVYKADQDTNNVTELYSVPLGGPSSAGAKLNGPLVLNGYIPWFVISPDSQRVAFLADKQTDEVFELYSTPLSGRAATTIGLNASNGSAPYGTLLTFTATVTSPWGTPTGTVQFQADGAPLGDPASLIGGVASIGSASLSAGSHQITAQYSGDLDYMAAEPASPLNQLVTTAATAIALTSSSGSAHYGTAATFTATVTSGGGTPTGTVQFQVDGTDYGDLVPLVGGVAGISTVSLSAGSHQIMAKYGGDLNFNGAETALPLIQMISRAVTVVALTASQRATPYGTMVTFTATITSSGGIPTGTVQFQVDGTDFGDLVPLVGGAAGISTASLPVGSHQITAVYIGDLNFMESNTLSPLIHEIIPILFLPLICT